MKFLKKFVSTLMATVLIVLNTPFTYLVAHAATEYKTVSCSTYTSKECTGPVEGRYGATTTCSICGSTKSNWSGTCKSCGQYISFSACAHAHPGEGEDPTKHYARTYTDSMYGYSGNSSTFKVYPLTVTASSGITYSVSVAGATKTDYVLPGKMVNIQFSNAPSGYNIKVSSTQGQYTIKAGGTYRFVMPESAITVQAVATTETASIYIGYTCRGPAQTYYYYDPSGKFLIDGYYYTNPDNILWGEYGGFVSKSVSGTIQIGEGNSLNCGNFSASTAGGNGPSSPYANTTYGGAKHYGVFFDIPSKEEQTVNFTPSTADVANRVKIGYANDFGEISSFTTVTSTSTITFNCKWFVIFLPGDLVEGIDNLVIKVLPTASAAEYNATLSTISVAGGSVVNGIGEVVQGTWSWESPDTKLTSLGNKSYNATFTES